MWVHMPLFGRLVGYACHDSKNVSFVQRSNPLTLRSRTSSILICSPCPRLFLRPAGELEYFKSDCAISHGQILVGWVIRYRRSCICDRLAFCHLFTRNGCQWRCFKARDEPYWRVCHQYKADLLPANGWRLAR